MAAIAAAVVASVGATTASAKVVTVTDDAAAQFSDPAAVRSDTVVRTLTDGDGAVELARTLEEQFDGTALPAGWTSVPWGTGGVATVAGGAVLVDGTLLDSHVPAGPGSSLQFTATFGTEQFQHVGFATDFDTQPWAIFSTGGGALPTGLYARTSDGAGGLDAADTPITATPGPHTFRIDWTQTGFEYFVDGTSVAKHDVPVTAPMRVAASDVGVDGAGASIDSAVLNTHKPSGTFVSRALDAGDRRVTGVSLDAASATPAPAGTAIAYDTRTAETAGGLTTAPWVPLGAGGTVESPKQFVQYRASLSTSNAGVTPRLDKVDVAFTIDDEAPKVTISDVAVAGRTAKVTFSRDDASASVACSLDGAAFAACTSPAEFGGLDDGPHEIRVRATDAVGNDGTDTKQFGVDTKAPTVTISDVAVSGGTAKVTFGSDDGAAVTSCKLDGGAFAPCASPAEFSGLAAGAHTIVVQATDAAGNVGSATRTFPVTAAPGGPGTTPPPGGNTPPPTGTAPDRSAPKMQVLGRSLRVSESGTAKLRIRCPRSEVSCAVTVTLKLGKQRIARKTLQMPGGTVRAFRLRLSKSARAMLAVRSRLSVTAVVAAEDAAGNRKTTKHRMTLRAAVR